MFIQSASCTAAFCAISFLKYRRDVMDPLYDSSCGNQTQNTRQNSFCQIHISSVVLRAATIKGLMRVLSCSSGFYCCCFPVGSPTSFRKQMINLVVGGKSDLITFRYYAVVLMLMYENLATPGNSCSTQCVI